MSGVFGEQEKCSDSDKGINYNDKGAVTAVDEEKPYVDYCIGEETLVEFYCKEVKCSPQGEKRCKPNPINRIKRVVKEEKVQICNNIYEGWETLEECESDQICKTVDGNPKCVDAPGDPLTEKEDPDIIDPFPGKPIPRIEKIVAFIPILGRVISREGDSVVKSYEKSGIARFIEGIRVALNSIGSDRGLPDINSQYVDYVRPAHKCASSEVCVAGACQPKNGCSAISKGIGSASGNYDSNKDDDKYLITGFQIRWGWNVIKTKEDLFKLLEIIDDLENYDFPVNSISYLGLKAANQVKEQFQEDDEAGWCPPPDSSKSLNCVVVTPEENPGELVVLKAPKMAPYYLDSRPVSQYICKPRSTLQTINAEADIPYVLDLYTKTSEKVAAATFFNLWHKLEIKGKKYCKGVTKDGEECVWMAEIKEGEDGYKATFTGKPKKWDLNVVAKGRFMCVQKPDKWHLEGASEVYRKCVEKTAQE